MDVINIGLENGHIIAGMMAIEVSTQR